MVLHFLVAEIEREGGSTARILDRVPDQEYDWRPHPRSMSLGELAYHIATLPGTVAEVLRSGSFDITGARPGSRGHAESPARTFRRIHAEIVAWLKQQDEEWGRESVSITRGSDPVFSMSRASVIRTIMLNHGYHHRGQLTVYLRLLDIPVPALFGTSADENAWER